MPVAAEYYPDPRLALLGSEFGDPVGPADFPAAILRYRNARAAESVGLGALTDREWIDAFARFEPLPGSPARPLALRYHGHQFRVYNPDLGDGRGFLYAQLRDRDGRLLDLGTKGSGQTPWSRQGDGRLTLKGGVREVLATAMLEALGVPTSKSISLIETGEALQRSDEPSPTRSAVLTRLSFSHLRFGTLQRLAYLERADLMATLLDHIVETYQPDLLPLEGEIRVAAWLERVVALTAKMVARWMTAGFVHGVLNTDNMNINGESFDYGPYRFLPKSDPNFTAAYFDHAGLYAFGRQPEAVFWNLQQLAGCLTLLAADHAPLIAALESFGPAYRRELAAAVTLRLGVQSGGEEADVALASALFRALAEGGEAVRWEPVFFDWFGGKASEARALSGPRRHAYAGQGFRGFRERLAHHAPDRPERLEHSYFVGSEPQELLIGEIEAIWSTIAADDDWRPFEAKLVAMDQARAAMDLAPKTPTAIGT